MTADKWAGVINYLIGIGLLACALFFLKKKNEEQPQMKIYGLTMKNLMTIIYAGIAIEAFLILAILVGWTTK